MNDKQDTPPIQQAAHSQYFRVLSLDGGGIRGAFTAAFLAEIEEQTKQPVCKYFDLIAGTSTGAIIAIALAFGIPAAKIRELYDQHGKAIFKRTLCGRAGLLFAKYSQDELVRAAGELLGARALGEANNRLVIPAIDLTRGKTVVFKTPHYPGLVRDVQMKAIDAIRATTAAPTYFPPARINKALYCDGGLWANNPGIVAHTEARLIIDKNQTNFANCAGIRLLSVGTGESTYYHDRASTLTGKLYWATRLVDVTLASQTQGVHFTLDLLLKDNYERIDFQIPGHSWKLDDTNILDALMHLGKEEAVKKFARVKQAFLTTEAKPFNSSRT
jgi:patatin-like phospholipase/acyl hydrolase